MIQISKNQYHLIQSELRKLCKPNNYLSFAIASVDLFFFGLFQYYAIFSVNLIFRLIASVLCGLFIGLLFIVAHDACHQSFFSKKYLNHFFGRICFLPSFHSFSLWEVEHNWRHHAFTNIHKSDHAYSPISLEEYRSLNLFCRMWHKLLRSPLGFSFYYLLTVHLPYLIFPNKQSVKKVRFLHFADGFLVILGLCLWLSMLSQAREDESYMLTLFFSLLLPQIFWNFLVTTVTYTQHTHPDIPWFEKADDWDFASVQTLCVTDINLGKVGNFVFHNVSLHTAHHLNSKIPLYRLIQAEKRLLGVVGDRMLVFNWSFKSLFKTIKLCKLYDYKRHSWIDFQGKINNQIEEDRRPLKFL